MGDIGTSISATIPAVGTAGTTYASNINLFLTEVKNRLESKVPRLSLEEGDFDLNGYDLQNALTIGFSARGSTPSTPTGTLQMFNNELYWVGSGGVVQITDGDALNSAAVGGITGDYGSPNPAQFRFVDADQAYYAYDNYSTGAWASLFGRYIDIAAGNTGDTRLRLEFDGLSSYTVKFPAELPADNYPLYMSAAGELTTQAPQPVTLTVAAGSGRTIQNFAGSTILTTNGTDDAIAYLFFEVPTGVTVTDYKVYLNKTTDAGTSITTTLVVADMTNGTTSATPGTGTEITTANAPGYTTLLKTGLSQAITENKVVYITILVNTATSGDQILSASLTYTPA